MSDELEFPEFPDEFDPDAFLAWRQNEKAARRSASEIAGELERTRRLLAEAIDALDELVAWQNGPPLETPRYIDGWGQAMQRADRVIDQYRRSTT